MSKLPVLFVALWCPAACSGPSSKPAQSVLLFKDKDGLYLYDAATGKEKIMFKADTNQVFLDEPYRLSGDTLSFGFCGELTYKKMGDYADGENYYNEYYSVDLASGKSWLSGRTYYARTAPDSLKIRVIRFDGGRPEMISDSTDIYHGSTSSYKGVVYHQNTQRFFSKDSLMGKTVFSLAGDIYYTAGADTVLLARFKGSFDPKFGGGYYQPRFDPSGSFIVVRYSPDFLALFEKPSLQKIDLSGKSVEILKKGEYYEPVFSADGKFILFRRDGNKGALDTWKSEIWILELATGNEQKIGEAYSAQWK